MWRPYSLVQTQAETQIFTDPKSWRPQTSTKKKRINSFFDFYTTTSIDTGAGSNFFATTFENGSINSMYMKIALLLARLFEVAA
jgi:hypothetical protein